MGPLGRRAQFLKRSFRRRFPKSLGDPEVPLSLDMDGDSRTLLVAFGGMQGRIGMPPFEFFSLTGEIPVKRLFVRDLRQAWYHQGMPEHGASLEAVAASLGELIAGYEVDRLVMAGNSAGGYAALVFGTLLGADTVLCFAPQTVLDLDVLGSIGDHRWDGRLRELTAAGALDPRWIDLGEALPRARRADAHTRYQVYFDDSLAVDRLHAERVLGLPGMRPYRFGGGAHHLVRELRDSGALERILQRALHVPRHARARGARRTGGGQPDAQGSTASEGVS